MSNPEAAAETAEDEVDGPMKVLRDLLEQQEDEQALLAEIAANPVMLPLEHASEMIAYPLTMTLTEEEIDWALDIKRAVQESNEEILLQAARTLTDFEYAQYGLATEGDLEGALFRVRGMQEFFEEYNVQGNCMQEGKELLRGMMEVQPFVVLEVAYEPLRRKNPNNPGDLSLSGGHFITIYDVKAVRNDVKLPEDWRKFLGGRYYMEHLSNATLYSIREAQGYVVETQGLTFNNLCMEHMKTTWHHLLEFYPKRFKDQKMYLCNTGVFGNMLHAVMKLIMGEKHKNVAKVGCNISKYDEDTRLDEYYKMPSPEIAKAKLMQNFEQLLAIRMHNQKHFKLRKFDNPVNAGEPPEEAAAGDDAEQ